jgi:hypothetical protein
MRYYIDESPWDIREVDIDGERIPMVHYKGECVDNVTAVKIDYEMDKIATATITVQLREPPKEDK